MTVPAGGRVTYMHFLAQRTAHPESEAAAAALLLPGEPELEGIDTPNRAALQNYLLSAPPNCGDGVLQTDEFEECDDGNLIATDGCTDFCRLPVCGDGIVRAGVEECDDGNGNDLDECSNACTLPVLRRWHSLDHGGMRRRGRQQR